MREIRRSALVAASPQHMFELINDIERYPEFVPGCSGASVLERSPDSLRAKLTVGSGAFRTSFVTRNRLAPHTHIHMTLDEGPFRSLDGVWTLTPVAQPGSDALLGCRVELQLRFELKGGIANLALGPAIERMASTLVDAFAARARARQALPGPGTAD
jgi:ribosome-associated toxin RatA of RatAB toxin-antitoxin module